MDPNEALNEIRRIIERNSEHAADLDQLVRLMELVDGLDGWITRGGFLPAEWAPQLPVQNRDWEDKF